MKLHHLLWGIVALSLLAALGFMYRAPILLGYFERKIPDITLKAHQDHLEEYITIYPPDESVSAPYPAIVLMPGCAGFNKGHELYWAKAANEAGYLAITVDSHGARGLNREEGLALVCNGKALLGQERAGDALALYDHLTKREDVDQSRIALAGWSHGGWTAMDLMTMDMKKHRPAQLIANGDLAVPSFSSVVMFYPYCGAAAHSQSKPWTGTPPILTFFAGDDTYVSNKACAKVFSKLKKQGISFTSKTYAGAAHAFDDPDMEEEYAHLHDPAALEDAKARVIRFLKAH